MAQRKMNIKTDKEKDRDRTEDEKVKSKHIQKIVHLGLSSRFSFWKQMSTSETYVDWFAGIIINFVKEVKNSGFGSGILMEFPILDQKSDFDKAFVVLTSTRMFDDRCADPSDFQDKFDKNTNTTEPVIAFHNLSKDAILVVPRPQSDEKNTQKYHHLASYLTHSSQEDIRKLLQKTAEQVIKLHEDKERVANNTPLYVSTHGGGVPWLHIRLCNSPKYYHYKLYDV